MEWVQAEIELVIFFFFHLDSLKSAFLSIGLSRWASCPSGLPVMLLLGPPNGPRFTGGLS